MIVNDCECIFLCCIWSHNKREREIFQVFFPSDFPTLGAKMALNCRSQARQKEEEARHLDVGMGLDPTIHLGYKKINEAGGHFFRF